MQRKLPDLIERIYQAALSPEKWQDVLAEAIALSDSRSARMLVLNERADAVHSSIKHNIDDQYHQQYVQYFVNKCPWRPELANKPGGLLYSTYLDFSVKQPNFYRTEFYSDWAGPQDIAHGMCGTVYQSDGFKVQFLIQRTGDAGFYARDEQQLFNEQIVPHIRRALAMSKHIQEERTRHGVAIKLAQHGLPFVLLDHGRQLVYATEAAEEILRRGSTLYLSDGTLHVRDPGADRRLQRLLKRSTIHSAAQWLDAGGQLQCRAQDSAETTQLLVSPIQPSSERLLVSDGRPLIAVLIHAPENRPQLDDHALALRFGLTPAEARTAALLATGLRAEQIADRLGLSLLTVRSRLRDIMSKTGTRRQAELVGLLLRAAPPTVPSGNLPRLAPEATDTTAAVSSRGLRA
ncbi:helix-turn-helix transcriptional regulator [Solimonas marina]|uniref:LuxR family transcriptional regulator n=1 Tax=Solimonas marina TaxID=2714601 RepID=A0A970B6E3_9GAMM|nr:helix-turn-helix transcriptional regulator [Solimonas marina]NKF22703.1 LuxR family transcriptional regulator [Solimonas marina]